jgi:peptide/nickel transport system substrate-binding protein
VLFHGTGRIATHPLGGGWAFNPELDDEGYHYDVELAREHLEAAGAVGETYVFTIGDTRFNRDLAQLLQDQYSQIDLNMEIEVVPAADAFALVVEGVTNWNPTSWAPRADPDGLLRILFHTDGFQNTSRYSNPEVDRLLDEAATIYDTDQARELYTEAERIIVEDASFIFIHFPSVFAARRAEVEDFVYHPDLILRFRDVRLTS